MFWMWCEQNKKRTLSAVSHLRVKLPPYCDDTNRAAGPRGWWSRRVASGARVTSCSHSRFEGGNYRQFVPDASVHSGACHVSVTRIFLEGAAGSVRPLKGVSSICHTLSASAAYSSAAPHLLRSASSRCAAAMKEALL